MQKFPSIIQIHGDTFYLVKRRIHKAMGIYKNNDRYLRMGPKHLINKEIEFQKTLLKKKFPVPDILDEGNIDGMNFFIEKGLGKMRIMDLFMNDYRKQGKISLKNFSTFLALTKKFAKAQLLTSTKLREEFDRGIDLRPTITDFPKINKSLHKAVRKVKSRVSVFPVVLSHGDLNPANFLQRGIIDFEFSFRGYAGYDLVGNIYHTYMFPASRRYEGWRAYEFTDKQIFGYLETLDSIYNKCDLPKISDYKEDFVLAKMIWSAANMGRWPKVQQWRFKLLKKMTDSYLNGNSAIDILMNFPP